MTERVSEDMVIADMLKLDPGIGPIQIGRAHV